jgi:hypothetical protein
MMPEFFNEFPELKADIASTESKLGYVPCEEIKACEFENIGESFGVGCLEELELLSAGLLGGDCFH